MNTLHSKSPCCQGKIYKLGQRRRQCNICKRTWRIRKKKRGRKTKRTNGELSKRYLSNGSFNLAQHASMLEVGVAALRYRNRKSRDCFLKNEPCPDLPKHGKLILIIDALMNRINSQRHSTYLMLIKPINANEAIILPPLILPGWENGDDWRKTILTIPEAARKRIVVLVGDGKPCFKGISNEFGWLLQRCHFHLLAELYRHASFKRKSQNQKVLGRMIKLTRKIITEPDGKKANRLIKRMEKFKKDSATPKIVKKRFLGGFLKNYNFYRTYLEHPELKIPNTSNACELINSFIRKLLFQARGFRSEHSYSQWIKALLLSRKTITCRCAKFLTEISEKP